MSGGAWQKKPPLRQISFGVGLEQERGHLLWNTHVPWGFHGGGLICDDTNLDFDEVVDEMPGKVAEEFS